LGRASIFCTKNRFCTEITKFVQKSQRVTN
jgi:hypothetical protein